MARGKINSAGAVPHGMEDYDAFEDLSSVAEFPSAIKEFVHPGDDAVSLLMRTFFADENQANASVLFYQKCVKFNLEDGKKLLLNKLAAQVSVKGLARDQLLQSVVGIIRESGLKSKIRKKNKEDAE